MFTVQYARGVAGELKALPAGIRQEILRVMEEQLPNEPTKVTRNRKPLPGFRPPFEHRDPVWELRIRDYRVYYDVDEEANEVTVRAIRQKPPHRTTEAVV
jgi:mRNA-degrading endonuclease RelE of RelBE toxin-antitoxin system